MFDNGYLVIGRVLGAPVRVHWSTAVGLVVLSGFSFTPGIWLGFLAVLLIHEIGHAMIARHFGLMLLGIDVNAFGGACRAAGDPTRRQVAIIAWGGVLAQAALLVAAIPLAWILPSGGFLGDLTHTLTWTNVYLIALNLLPIPPLDGATAWKLFKSPLR